MNTTGTDRMNTTGIDRMDTPGFCGLNPNASCGGVVLCQLATKEKRYERELGRNNLGGKTLAEVSWAGNNR